MPDVPGQDDDALRRQLNEQVLQLAEYDKRKYDNDLWEQELKKEQQKRTAREKEEAEIRRRSGAPSAFTEAATEIIASVLAYLTWIIAGAVVLFAAGGGFWLWRNMNAVDELKQPLAYNVGNDKGDVDAETLKIAEKEAGKAVAKGGRPLTPAEKAKLEAAAKQAAKQAAAGEKEAPGDGDEKGTPDGDENAEGKDNSEGKEDAKDKHNAQKSADKTPTSKNKNAQKSGKPSTPSQKPSGQKNAAHTKQPNQPNKQQPGKQPPQATNASKKTTPRSQPKMAAKTPASDKKPRLAALPPSLRNKKPQQSAKPQPRPVPTSTHRSAHSRQLMLQLKRLWNQGKTAKHRGDYAGAKRAWQQALKLCPGHPGFAPSIQKLAPRS